AFLWEGSHRFHLTQWSGSVAATNGSIFWLLPIDRNLTVLFVVNAPQFQLGPKLHPTVFVRNQCCQETCWLHVPIFCRKISCSIENNPFRQQNNPFSCLFAILSGQCRCLGVSVRRYSCLVCSSRVYLSFHPGSSVRAENIMSHINARPRMSPHKGPWFRQWY